jgi:cytochrome c oxidase subunit 2
VGLVLLVAAALAVAGCADDAPNDTLDPAGPEAETIADLSNYVFIVAGVVFVIVQALIVYAVLKFRRRRDDTDEELPDQIHGNIRLELGWTILPALVLGLVALFTVPVIFDLNDEPEGAMQVDVWGQKYWWGYEYPDQELVPGGGIVTANELHIPAGEPVYLTLRSRDVIHSFWTPRLNGKRDVVPGRTHTWTIEADEPGVYAGQCGEYCGTSHANMNLKVVAHDAEGFARWVEDNQEPAEELAEDDESPEGLGYALFQQRGCAGCHEVDGVWEEVAEDAPPAPNLTHLYDRECFAGCIYDLNDRNEVEAWLRNPQRKAGSLMVIGELTEEDIDNLYAYLRTLE